MIQTVCGQMDAKDLGYCQMHEHLIVREGPATQKFPALLIDDEAKSAQELARYFEAGGRSILDAQPGGAGRDAHALKRISETSQVNIISVTGFHLPMFYRSGHWIFTEPKEQLRDRFYLELTWGINDAGSEMLTPIRAGAVKAAIGEDGPVGRAGECLWAAAAAASDANVPLIVHTERGIGAVDAIKICASAGLKPEKVIVCHVDRQATDTRIHEEIARTGVYLDYDTIARYKYHDDASEVQLILHMIEKGYAERLLLAMDTTVQRLTSYGADVGLDFILRSFLPALRDAGVTENLIQTITVDNPARVFA